MRVMLRNSTGALSLTGDDAFVIDDWAPAIALRQGEEYLDVSDTMRIAIRSDPSRNLARLLTYLDNAMIDPVTIECTMRPGGQVWQATITGVPEIRLPGDYTRSNATQALTRISLQYARSGLWTIRNGGQVASSASVNDGAAVAPSTGFAHNAVGPWAQQTLRITLSPNGSQAGALGGYVLAGPASSIAILSGESYSSASPYGSCTVTAPAVTQAQGGYVMRFLPVEGGGTSDVAWGHTSATTAKRIAVYASLKNASSTISYKITPYVNYAGGNLTAYGAPFILAAGSVNPQVVLLGEVSFRGPSASVGILMTHDGTSGTNALDIDYLAVLDLTSELATAVRVDGYTPSTGTVDWFLPESVTSAISYGDRVILYGESPRYGLGTSAACAVLANTGSLWRLRSGISDALTPFTANWTRYHTALAPY